MMKSKRHKLNAKQPIQRVNHLEKQILILSLTHVDTLVEFKDEAIQEYNVNIIVEAIYSNIDDDGHYIVLLDSIFHHRKLNSVLNHENAFLITKLGQRRIKYTTKRWEFSCK